MPTLEGNKYLWRWKSQSGAENIKTAASSAHMKTAQGAGGMFLVGAPQTGRLFTFLS